MASYNSPEPACSVNWPDYLLPAGTVLPYMTEGLSIMRFFPPFQLSLFHLCLPLENFGKLSSGHSIPKKGNAKECSNCHTIALISHASKVMLKILQARLQQYVNCELPDVKAGFRKGRGTGDQIANIHWIIKKAREFQKNIYFCFIDYTKAFDCVDHNKLKIFERDGHNRSPDLPLEKPVCRSGSNSEI